MGSIVSVKQRARKKTIAITAFGSQIYQMPAANKIENFETEKDAGKDIPKVVNINKVQRGHGRKINGFLDTNQANKVQVAIERKKENSGANFVSKTEDGNVFERGPGGDADKPRGKDAARCKHNKNVRIKNDENENLLHFKSQRETNDENIRHENTGHGESFYPEGTNENHPQIAQQQHVAKPRENTNTFLHEDTHKKSPPTRHIKEWFKAVDSSDSRSSTPMRVALGSWGDGVVTTTDHQLHQDGHVTSRGVDVNVQNSVAFYSDFAHVISVQPCKTPELEKTQKSSRKSHCSDRNNGCDCKRCEADRRKAAIIIQSVLRGYQVRKEMQQRRSSVIKIQRLFRERVESSGGLQVMKEENQREQPLRKTSSTSKPWRESPTPTPVVQPQIGEKTKENFEMYQDDITELKWRSQRLIEQATMGEGYIPQRLLLIASNVGKPEFLARVSLENVHVIVYQFSEITLEEILQNISLALDDYRVGSKAKRIAFVCQGGPGYMYLCRGKVLTTPKLAKDTEMQRFIKGLGGYISKMDPEDAKIHIIGNNILGSKKGVKLFEAVTDCIKPNRCTIESPLEMSASGTEMLEEYFDVEKYKMWKRIRNTKIWL